MEAALRWRTSALAAGTVAPGRRRAAPARCVRRAGWRVAGSPPAPAPRPGTLGLRLRLALAPLLHPAVRCAAKSSKSGASGDSTRGYDSGSESGSESGYESESVAADTLGLTASQMLEQHGCAPRARLLASARARRCDGAAALLAALERRC